MKKIISLLLALVLCLSLCACGEKATPEMIEAYKNANACLSQGRYKEAATFYIDAGNYEDTDQKLLEIYYYAVNCYEQMNFNEAAPLFRILANAGINESQKYLDSFGFYELLENAKIQFEQLHNVTSALELIDDAMKYATFEELGTTATKYRESIIAHLFEGTHFYKPNAPVETIAAEAGKYIHYRYRYNDFNNYYGDNEPHELGFLLYALQEYHESQLLKPVPKEIKEITGMESDSAYLGCDDLGNLLYRSAHDSQDAKKTIYGYTDVFIFYAEYVESLTS